MTCCDRAVLEADAERLIRVRGWSGRCDAEVLYDGKIVATFSRIGNFYRDALAAADEHARQLRAAFVDFHLTRAETHA